MILACLQVLLLEEKGAEHMFFHRIYALQYSLPGPVLGEE